MTNQELITRIQILEEKIDKIYRNIEFELESITIKSKTQFFDKVLDKNEDVVVN